MGWVLLACLAWGLTPAWGVDVNQASAKELEQIKGIGAKTAKRIVAERARGPFESLEHLAERLSGIGPKTVVRLKEAGLCAGSATESCAPAPAKPAAAGQAHGSVTPAIIRLQ